MLKIFFEEIEKLKFLLKDINRNVEDNAHELFSILSNLLEDSDLSNDLKKSIVELVSSLQKDVQKIKAKILLVERHHYDKDIQELDQLRTSLGQNIWNFIYGDEIKRFKDYLMRPRKSDENKAQNVPSSPEGPDKDSGKKAGIYEGTLHEDNISELDPRLILEFAEKFISPDDSPVKRIAIAGEIYKWAVGERADIGVSLQRA